MENVPEPFWRGVLRSLENVYQEGWQRSHNDPLYETTEARFILPYTRRALFERQLRHTATLCGLPNTTMDNVARNCSYSLVRAGRFAFTASAIRTQNDVTRPASFRKQHASVNDFLRAPTLAFMNSQEIFAPDEIYAIIVHLPNAFDPTQLGFAGIGIPSADTESWLEYPWNLIDLISIYHQERPQPSSSEDDRAHPKIKKDRKRKGDDE
jgi:hypothetical protein